MVASFDFCVMFGSSLFGCVVFIVGLLCIYCLMLLMFAGLSVVY